MMLKSMETQAPPQSQSNMHQLQHRDQTPAVSVKTGCEESTRRIVHMFRVFQKNLNTQIIEAVVENVNNACQR